MLQSFINEIPQIAVVTIKVDDKFDGRRELFRCGKIMKCLTQI